MLIIVAGLVLAPAPVAQAEGGLLANMDPMVVQALRRQTTASTEAIRNARIMMELLSPEITDVRPVAG